MDSGSFFWFFLKFENSFLSVDVTCLLNLYRLRERGEERGETDSWTINPLPDLGSVLPGLWVVWVANLLPLVWSVQ